MLFAFVNSLNWVLTNSFPWSVMINMGPQYWIHRSAMLFTTVAEVLSGIGMHNWYNVLQHTMLQEKIVELELNLEKIHTKCFVEAKGPRLRWKPRFWRMPFGCTCWTLDLSSHVVENLWPGTAETKSPQEFLLAQVPTIVMDILKELLLARCSWFSGTCFTVATILIVKRHFVRHQLISNSTLWIEFVLLSPREKNKPRSSLSDLTWIVSFDVSLASGV